MTIAVQRVLILCTSARNPFLEAWVACIRATGVSVAVLVDARRTREMKVPDVLVHDTVLLTHERSDAWEREVVELLGGTPQVIFDWWGMAALAEPLVGRAWPAARHVLCVDTFPNASRWRAAARDVVQANVLLGRASGLVFASRAMEVAVARATAGRSRALPSAVVYSPFPLSSHRAPFAEPRGEGPLRLCFTGRSDHLFSSDPRMSKDAVGTQLQRFIELGGEVHVQRPGRAADDRALLDRGFNFYPEVPRDEILTGGFAEAMGAFDGHLVIYAQPNRTATRRVQSSLSTRFATAVCASAPIVAPVASAFVEELFGRWRIGFRSDDAEETMDVLRAEGRSMRSNWAANHHQWAGEAFAEDLRELWAAAARRTN